MQKTIVIAILMAVFFGGCATAQSPGAVPQQQETQQDVTRAVGAIADAVSNPGVGTKYCPVCGKHYSYRVGVCPRDGVLLKQTEE